ncbi:hypothetical protein BDN72DRAFT_959553 [Pluteus cervinus]|uniref:Uncharacterized protein n=1 Tax=Pluteus cervinus TaxID=181527 RepID=A0ACD3AW35_9AGAR|nr:hypothetical protein BDN72DRAFT_959553 [Pluteus cervinus]
MPQPMPDQPGEVFPPEIEEMIFSMAVQANWSSAKTLVLVAKRVHHWLIPQLYEVVIFHENQISNPRPKFDSGKLIDRGKHVKHIMFFQMYLLSNRPGECLAWCPNAVDVALWITPDLYDKTLIDQLLCHRLTHLSFDFGTLRNKLGEHPEILKPTSFPFVTHLELINSTTAVTSDELREHFPALTHLALNASGPNFPDLEHLALDAFGPNLISVTPGVLTLWKDQMKVLLWYRGETTSPYPVAMSPDSGFPSPPDDARLVVIRYGRGYVGTWYEGTRGGLSIWRVAEEAIAARAQQVANRGSVD